MSAAEIWDNVIGWLLGLLAALIFAWIVFGDDDDDMGGAA